MQTSTKVILVSALAIIAGPGIAYVGWESKSLLASLEKDGVETDGMIVGGEWKKSRKGHTTHKFDVLFMSKEGGKITKNFEVTADYFGQHASNDAITNEKARVKYLPSDINKAILVGGSTDDSFLFPVGIVVGLAGVGVLAYMLKRKKEEPAAAPVQA